jgi:hypothetical protein
MSNKNALMSPLNRTSRTTAPSSRAAPPSRESGRNQPIVDGFVTLLVSSVAITGQLMQSTLQLLLRELPELAAQAAALGAVGESEEERATADELAVRSDELRCKWRPRVRIAPPARWLAQAEVLARFAMRHSAASGGLQGARFALAAAIGAALARDERAAARDEIALAGSSISCSRIAHSRRPCRSSTPTS